MTWEPFQTLLEASCKTQSVHHVTVLKDMGPRVSDDQRGAAYTGPPALEDGAFREPPELLRLKMLTAIQNMCLVTIWISPGSQGSCSLHPAPRNTRWHGAGERIQRPACRPIKICCLSTCTELPGAVCRCYLIGLQVETCLNISSMSPNFLPHWVPLPTASHVCRSP